MQIRQKCSSLHSQYLSHANDKILHLYNLDLISDERQFAERVKFLLKNDCFNCLETDFKECPTLRVSQIVMSGRKGTN